MNKKIREDKEGPISGNQPSREHYSLFVIVLSLCFCRLLLQSTIYRAKLKKKKRFSSQSNQFIIHL